MKPELYSVPKRRLTPFYVMGILFVVTVVLPLLIFFNLKKYAVYYAEHTPHSNNVDTVAIEVIDNLQWNRFPNNSSYDADFDGINTLYIMNQTDNKVVATLSPHNNYKGNKFGFHFSETDDWSYFLDGNLNPTWGIGPEQIEKVKFTVAEKSKVRDKVKQFLIPMVQAQPKPIIFNLQWLYDLLNHDRFN